MHLKSEKHCSRVEENVGTTNIPSFLKGPGDLISYAIDFFFLMTMFLDLKTYKEKGEVRHWRANNILHYKVCALREEE